MATLNELLPFDENSDLRMVVESPKGATIKLKFEPALGLFRIKRALPFGLAYPFDWGFIPGTRGEDGDPVDALAIHGSGSFPGIVTTCKALGMVRFEQGKKKRISNPRLIVTPTWYDHPERTAGTLSNEFKAQIEQLFATAGFFAAANPKILGWSDASEAERHIREKAVN